MSLFVQTLLLFDKGIKANKYLEQMKVSTQDAGITWVSEWKEKQKQKQKPSTFWHHTQIKAKV